MQRRIFREIYFWRNIFLEKYTFGEIYFWKNIRPKREEVYMIVLPGGDCRVGAEGHWIDLNFSKIRTRANQYGKTSVKLSSSNCRQRESFNVIKGILVGNLSM